MKLSKFLGLLLIVAMMFVFVGCGDKGTILLEDSWGSSYLYEGETIGLTCTYADLRSWDEVQTISVHNKTTGEIISSVESKPAEFSNSIDINTDFTWVPDGEKEKVYEFYVQMGDKVSNTVSKTVRHAKELICYPDYSDYDYAGAFDASYNDTVYSIPFDYVSFTVFKNIPLHLTNEESDLQENAIVYRYLKRENETEFTKTEVILDTSNTDYLYDRFNYYCLFDESEIGSICQIYYVYPEENIKTDIVSFELTEGVRLF